MAGFAVTTEGVFNYVLLLGNAWVLVDLLDLPLDLVLFLL
jgi:hypothetical protein